MMRAPPPCHVQLACYALRQGLPQRKQALLTRVLATGEVDPRSVEA